MQRSAFVDIQVPIPRKLLTLGSVRFMSLYETSLRPATMIGQDDNPSGLDRKSTPELVELALAELEKNNDEPVSCPALSALHARGTREVLQAAVVFCRSASPIQRKLGASILGELGTPSRTFPDECCDELLGLVQSESDNNLISTAVFMLGHLGNSRCEPFLLPLSKSPDPAIRHAVAFALCGTTSPASIKVLVELMEDSFERVRDWATTGIAQTLSVDGPDIRAALRRRASDSDELSRAEALHGLARRKDDYVALHLINSLSQQSEYSHLFVDAAKTYLGLNESQNFSPEEIIKILRTQGAANN